MRLLDIPYSWWLRVLISCETSDAIILTSKSLRTPMNGTTHTTLRYPTCSLESFIPIARNAFLPYINQPSNRSGDVEKSERHVKRRWLCYFATKTNQKRDLHAPEMPSKRELLVAWLLVPFDEPIADRDEREAGGCVSCHRDMNPVDARFVSVSPYCCSNPRGNGRQDKKMSYRLCSIESGQEKSV